MGVGVGASPCPFLSLQLPAPPSASAPVSRRLRAVIWECRQIAHPITQGGRESGVGRLGAQQARAQHGRAEPRAQGMPLPHPEVPELSKERQGV